MLISNPIVAAAVVHKAVDNMLSSPAAAQVPAVRTTNWYRHAASPQTQRDWLDALAADGKACEALACGTLVCELLCDILVIFQ